MSKSNNFENAFLLLAFNAVAIAGIAENHSSPVANLPVAFHTADPGEAGDMTTNECTYTSYARVNVARTAGGWAVTGNSVSPVSDILFPQATGGSETITHFSIGTGNGDDIMVYGTVTPNIAVSDGVRPGLAAGTTITED